MVNKKIYQINLKIIFNSEVLDKHRQSLSDQDSSEENEDDYLESMQKLYDFEHFNEGCHESTKNVNTKNLELKEKQLRYICILIS